jgi:phage shock protein A
LQITTQANASDKLYNSMGGLEGKITEAKREKEMLIAKAKTAQTSIQVNDMLNNIGDGSSSMGAFERMKAKVDSLEVQAEVAGEMAASSTGTSMKLEDRFKALEGGSKVDDELAALKRSLPSAKKDIIGELPSPSAIGELPAPATAESKSQLDLEYERLKAELESS